MKHSVKTDSAAGKKASEIVPRHADGSCLSKLKSMNSSTNSAGSRIARFILNDPDEATQFTIYDIARRANTSVATVSRFCSRLGYKNYRLFQRDLIASLSGKSSSISDTFEVNDTPATIVRRVFEINRQSLVDTEKLIKSRDLDSIAKLIISAKRMFLIGVGGSGLIAKSAALRFESLGIAATAISDPFEGLFNLADATREDIVVGISHTGRSSAVLKLIDFVKGRSARTVGITNYADAPLAKKCEYPLVTSFRERRISAAVSSSRIAQMCVLDALYFLSAHHIDSTAEGRAQIIEDAAESLFRN